MKKPEQKRGTSKQERFLTLLVDNYGNPDRSRSLGELMREAGYSEASSMNPKVFLDSPLIKEKLDDFINELDRKRRMALKHITEKKLEKASARDNAAVVDTLTKNHQLLSGEKTANVSVETREVNAMTQEEIDAYLKDKLNGSTERP